MVIGWRGCCPAQTCNALISRSRLDCVVTRCVALLCYCGGRAGGVVPAIAITPATNIDTFCTDTWAGWAADTARADSGLTLYINGPNQDGEMGDGSDALLSLQCPSLFVIDVRFSVVRLGAFYIYSPFFPQRTTERYNQPRNFRQQQRAPPQLLPCTPLTRNNVPSPNTSTVICCGRLSASAAAAAVSAGCST